MFKKIELWFLLLVILFLLVFSFLFGGLVRQELEGSTKFGLISKSALEISRIPARLKWIFSTKNTNPQYLRDSSEEVITLKDNSFNSNHLYLLSRYSPEHKQGIVELRKLKDLALIHTYIPKQNQFFDMLKGKENYSIIKNNSLDTRFQIDSPILNYDGSITGISANSLFKLNLCDNLEILNFDKHSHQSLNIDANENYVSPIIIKDTSNEYSSYYVSENFENNGIGIFSKDGNLLFSKSISEILIDNGYLGFLLGMDRKLFEDPIHLNDIEPANYDTDYFKKGDLFLSLRHRSAIIHYRPSINKILDIIIGPFSHQHDVDILDHKTLTIFNNNTINTQVNSPSISVGEKIIGHNEILKYDLQNKKFSKLINKAMKDANVSTITQGLVEIKKDYILVEEHDSGNIHLFNKNNKIIWQFKNVSKDKKYRLSWGRIEDNSKKNSKVIEIINSKKCLD